MKNKFSKENILLFLKRLIKKPLLYVILGLFLLDLMTKWIMVWHFKYDFNAHSSKDLFLIPGFIYVTLLNNTGAMGGLFGSNNVTRIILVIFRCLLAIGLPIGYFILGKDIKRKYKICLSLIYAGCIGNLVDSIFYHQNIVGFEGVVDWIGITFFWPPYPDGNLIFNLADSYIVIAVFLAIIFLIVDEIKEVKERSRRGEYSMTPEEYEKKLQEEKKQNETNNK